MSAGVKRYIDPELLDPVDRAYYYWNGGDGEDPADAGYVFTLPVAR